MKRREMNPVAWRVSTVLPLVFGATTAQARAVVEAIAREAFHNVSFFDGGVERFRSAARP